MSRSPLQLKALGLVLTTVLLCPFENFATAEGAGLISIIIPSQVAYFGELASSVTKKSAELGHECSILEYGNDLQKQNDAIKNAIARKTAAIVCWLRDPVAALPELTEARAAGIPCCIIDSNVTTIVDFATEIVPDYYQGATLAAQEFARLMGYQGQYIALTGISAQARTILGGYNLLLSQYPKLEAITVTAPENDPSRAFALVIDTISARPEIKGVLATGYESAVAASKAIHGRAKGDVIVVAFGTVEKSLRRDGVSAAVLWPVKEMAEAAVNDLDQRIKSKQINKTKIIAIGCSVLNANEQLSRPFSEPPQEPWSLDVIFDNLISGPREIKDSEVVPEAGDNLDLIQRDAITIQKVTKAKPDVPPAYRNGLTIDAWMVKNIRTAVRQEGAQNKAQLADWIKDTKDSVRAKAEFADKHQQDPFAPVTVTARTFDKDGSESSKTKESSGYEVWCCSVGEIPFPKRHESFGKLSSPTEKSVEPGNYLFWTRKESACGPGKNYNNIGLDGQPEVAIDLLTGF